MIGALSQAITAHHSGDSEGGGQTPTDAVLISTQTQRFPEIGEEVAFKRSPTHHEEWGYVRARSFGTRRLEVIDAGGKPLSLLPGQYRLQEPGADDVTAAGGRAHE